MSCSSLAACNSKSGYIHQAKGAGLLVCGAEGGSAGIGVCFAVLLFGFVMSSIRAMTGLVVVPGAGLDQHLC